MTQELSDYAPFKVWKWAKETGGKFNAINRPISGATFEKDLPIGKHPLQLYSQGTPNGVKVTILLEELLEAGCDGADYDAWLINILEGDQFGSGFVELNPNSKIPAMLDRDTSTHVFESGSILLYLAEKFEMYIPKNLAGRTACINWLMWQMGSTPFLGGGFGHFYSYAPIKIEYAIDRYAMEVKRQLDVLDKHLATHTFMAGDTYSIADMAIWPWYGLMALGDLYDAADFLSVHEYPNLQKWAKLINDRPAVQRGQRVNRSWGDDGEQLLERHDKSDFDKK